MSKEKLDDNQEGNGSVWKFFVAFAVVVVLVIAGGIAYKYYYTAQQNKNKYNGFPFYMTSEGFWLTIVEARGQPYSIPFYYHPRELEDVLVEENIEYKITKNPVRQIYISFDPDAGSVPVVGGVEISRITGNKYNLFNIKTNSALTREDNASNVENVVKTCEDAGSGVVVIVFEQGSRNLIHSEGDCIILNYEDTNSSIMVADAFVYNLLGIM